MAITPQSLKTEISALHRFGLNLLLSESHKIYNTKPKDPILKKEADGSEVNYVLHVDYQDWYTRCLPVVRQLMPDRLNEFCQQYKWGNRKEISFENYCISDYLIGLVIRLRGEEVVNRGAAFVHKMQLQVTILGSALTRLDSALNDIRGVLQAEMFDSELDVADELLKKKHFRASGAVAGVILETHLGRVAKNHQVPIAKKDPTIADLNDPLKSAGVLDVPTWRLIQHLADLRNLSVHAKGQEPTAAQIADLLAGVKKIISSVF